MAVVLSLRLARLQQAPINSIGAKLFKINHQAQFMSTATNSTTGTESA